MSVHGVPVLQLCSQSLTQSRHHEMPVEDSMDNGEQEGRKADGQTGSACVSLQPSALQAPS